MQQIRTIQILTCFSFASKNPMENPSFYKDRLTVEHYRKLLNKNEEVYTDEQIETIRDFVSFLVDLQLLTYKTKVKNEKELCHLHPGQYR